MAAGAIVGAVIVVGGAIMQRNASLSASKKQRRIDMANIAREKAENAESVRRTEILNKETEGYAKLQTAASGFAIGSSLDRYVRTIEKQHDTELAWMKMAGTSRTSIMRAESNARKRVTQASANAGLVSAVGGAVIGAFGGGGGGGSTTQNYGSGSVTSQPSIFNS